MRFCSTLFVRFLLWTLGALKIRGYDGVVDFISFSFHQQSAIQACFFCFGFVVTCSSIETELLLKGIVGVMCYSVRDHPMRVLSLVFLSLLCFTHQCEGSKSCGNKKRKGNTIIEDWPFIPALSEFSNVSSYAKEGKTNETIMGGSLKYVAIVVYLISEVKVWFIARSFLVIHLCVSTRGIEKFVSNVIRRYSILDGCCFWLPEERFVCFIEG